MSGFGLTSVLKSMTRKSIMHDKFEWDNFSDQPHIIKDKKFKKRIYKKAIFDQLITLFSTVILSPFILLSYLFLQQKRVIDTQNFFAMGVNLDKNPEETLTLIEELGVDTLLIRLPLWEIEKLDAYVAFVEKFKGKDILINILQDRNNIENLSLFEENIEKIFKAFPHIKKFQIGNAINRKKWAFYTIKEYLKLYQVAQRVRDKRYHDKVLLGSSVIDFEYHYTIRSLFNFFSLKYDIFTALLYVDRRGAPEGKQMGFDLKKKINLLHSIMILSPKSSNKLYITETNWPLSNTVPYAPTSEKECVNPEDYALYMLQYYLIALSTREVDRVYWHQLIAPGYGLVDNRDGIKKYPAFVAFQTMLKLLKGAHLEESNLTGEVKMMRFSKKSETIMIYWSDTLLDIKGGLSLYGKAFTEGKFCYHILLPHQLT